MEKGKTIMAETYADELKENSVSIKEAAKQLERNRRTIYNQIYLGKIESVKVGSEVRIPMREIQRILRQRNRVEIRHRKSA